jgi:hypothetical protein
VWIESVKGQSRYRPRGQGKTELSVPIKGTVLRLLERRASILKHHLKGFVTGQSLNIGERES